MPAIGIGKKGKWKIHNDINRNFSGFSVPFAARLFLVFLEIRSNAPRNEMYFGEIRIFLNVIR